MRDGGMDGRENPLLETFLLTPCEFLVECVETVGEQT